MKLEIINCIFMELILYRLEQLIFPEYEREWDFPFPFN
jgi:hypothetical protein